MRPGQGDGRHTQTEKFFFVFFSLFSSLVSAAENHIENLPATFHTLRERKAMSQSVPASGGKLPEQLAVLSVWAATARTVEL